MSKLSIDILFVNDQLVTCVGVAPMQCMQVREVATEPWQNFYQEIEGFKFEPGFSYQIEVNKTKVENPPADASSLSYKLVRILDKQKTAKP
ncbi:MAG: DUF4377 domain-containing protein [Vibrionaceae bacterium]